MPSIYHLNNCRDGDQINNSIRSSVNFRTDRRQRFSITHNAVSNDYVASRRKTTHRVIATWNSIWNLDVHEITHLDERNTRSEKWFLNAILKYRRKRMFRFTKFRYLKIYKRYYMIHIVHKVCRFVMQSFINDIFNSDDDDVQKFNINIEQNNSENDFDYESSPYYEDIGSLQTSIVKW